MAFLELWEDDISSDWSSGTDAEDEGERVGRWRRQPLHPTPISISTDSTSIMLLATAKEEMMVINDRVGSAIVSAGHCEGGNISIVNLFITQEIITLLTAATNVDASQVNVVSEHEVTQFIRVIAWLSFYSTTPQAPHTPTPRRPVSVRHAKSPFAPGFEKCVRQRRRPYEVLLPAIPRVGYD